MKSTDKRNLFLRIVAPWGGASFMIHGAILAVVLTLSPLISMKSVPSAPPVPVQDDTANAKERSSGNSAADNHRAQAQAETLNTLIKSIEHRTSSLQSAYRRRENQFRTQARELAESSLGSLKNQRDTAVSNGNSTASAMRAAAQGWAAARSAQSDTARIHRAEEAFKQSLAAEESRCATRQNLQNISTELSRLNRDLHWLKQDSLAGIADSLKTSTSEVLRQLDLNQFRFNQYMDYANTALTRIQIAAARKNPFSPRTWFDNGLNANALKQLSAISQDLSMQKESAMLDQLTRSLTQLQKMSGKVPQYKPQIASSEHDLPFSMDTIARPQHLLADSFRASLPQIKRQLDSAILQTQALQRALKHREPLSLAEQRIRERMRHSRADDSARSLISFRKNAEIVPVGQKAPDQKLSMDGFQSIYDQLLLKTKRSTSQDTIGQSHNSTPSKLLPLRQGETLSVQIQANLKSLKKLADKMRAIHDTLYAANPGPGYKDPTKYTVRLSPNDLAMLKAIFDTVAPETKHSSPPDRADRKKWQELSDIIFKQTPESQPAEQPVVFNLFPNVKMISKAVCRGGSPLLFAIPDNRVGSGQPNKQILPQVPVNGDEGLNTQQVINEAKSADRQLERGMNDLGRMTSAIEPGKNIGLSNLRPIWDGIVPPTFTVGKKTASGIGGAGNFRFGIDLSRNDWIDGFDDQKGSRVSKSGKPGRWFYIPGWYIVGPFPNPERQNITTAFPPERKVDLDATYEGKNGRRIGWEYFSSNHCAMSPECLEEFSIIYAFARVWVEYAYTATIATGGDDRTDIWINGVHVYVGKNALKDLNITEGVFSVHLNQGDNFILLRQENGWYGGEFSFVMSAGSISPKTENP